MKDPQDTPPRGALARRMRVRLLRGTEAVRRLIARARELGTSAEEGGDAAQGGGLGLSGLSEVRHAIERMARLTRGARPVAPGADGDDDDEGSPELGTVDLASEFVTATMGTILLAQGRVAEARAVFERLLRRNPTDEEARRGVAACAAREAASARPHAVVTDDAPAEPHEMLDRAPPPAGYNVSEAHALPVDPTTIVVFWELTPQALASALEDSPPGARLALHLVSSTGGSPRPGHERWVEPVPLTGDYFLRGLAPGAVHRAVIGLRVRGVFTPLVVAEPVATPRGRPAADAVVIRATLTRAARWSPPPSPPSPPPTAWAERASELPRVRHDAPAFESLVHVASERERPAGAAPVVVEVYESFVRAWTERREPPADAPDETGETPPEVLRPVHGSSGHHLRVAGGRPPSARRPPSSSGYFLAG